MSARERRRQREREGSESAPFRTLRLQELIKEEVNLLLRSEIRDSRLEEVTITMVDMAGECARLWFWAPGGDEALDALVGAAGFLRSRLAEALGLKRTPDLRFRRDRAARSQDFDNDEGI